MFFAEATNQTAGQFWYLLVGASGLVLALVAIGSYFATSRDVDKLSSAVDALTGMMAKLNEADERRVHEIHVRLNPLELQVGKLEGASEAFEKSFEKFTRIIEATTRASNETISAFTRSLDTFASVIERRERDRH